MNTYIKTFLIGLLVWLIAISLTAQGIGYHANTQIGQLRSGQFVEFVTETDTTCKIVGLSTHLTDGDVTIDTVYYQGKALAVDEIGDYAMYGNSQVTRLTVGKSVRRIGSMTSEMCVNLADVVIEGVVDSLCSRAFCGCRNLRNVKFNGGVRFIGSFCFANCPQLDTIVLPPTIVKVESMAFAGDTAVTIVISKPGFWEELYAFYQVRIVIVVRAETDDTQSTGTQGDDRETDASIDAKSTEDEAVEVIKEGKVHIIY